MQIAQTIFFSLFEKSLNLTNAFCFSQNSFSQDRADMNLSRGGLDLAILEYAEYARTTI